MCVFAVLLWVIIKGDLEKKRRDLYLSGNFGNVCREMVSNMNKAPQSGGTLSEQLGLDTTAACDTFLLAFPEHSLHMETCHHFCHDLGTPGASGEQISGSHDQNPEAPCCCLLGTCFFARPVWGCSVAGMLAGWYGRGWHCFLEQHQGCPLPWQQCDCTRATALLSWHFLKELRSWRASVHRWMPCSFVPTALTAVPLHRCLWNFSSFTEMQRTVQSNLIFSKRLS